VADGWIPLTGIDGDGRDRWINPAVVATVVFWTDRDQQQVATVELVNGSQYDLREAVALDRLIDLGRGEEVSQVNRVRRAVR
jgi:hypothetical protein